MLAAISAPLLTGLVLPTRQPFSTPRGRSVSPRLVAETDQPLREPARNVYGGELECCCADVHGSGIGTGFYRDGFCSNAESLKLLHVSR